MRTLRSFGRPPGMYANLNHLGPNAQKKDKTSLSIFLRSEPLRLETSRFVGAICLFSLLDWLYVGPSATVWCLSFWIASLSQRCCCCAQLALPNNLNVIGIYLFSSGTGGWIVFSSLMRFFVASIKVYINTAFNTTTALELLLFAYPSMKGWF